MLSRADQARRLEIRAELRSLLSQADSRAFTAAERSRIETLRAEDERLQIKDLATDDIDVAVRPRRTNADSGSPLSATTPTAGNADHGFRTPREFLTSVMHAGRGQLDDRLRGLWVTGDGRLQQLAVGSDEARGNSDPAGGFLVPQAFITSLILTTAEADPLAALTQKVPMETTRVRVPARLDKDHTTSVAGGVIVTRRPETVAATASQLNFAPIDLQAHSLMGLSYATEEILTDSPTTFAALLSASFSEAFGGHLVNERLFGTGVGEFLGVINSPCLISVTKESGQSADTVLYENVIRMRARCWGYAKAVWLANHDVLPQLMLLNQSIGTAGVPVWQPSARDDHPDSLLGRPLIFSEYCDKLGDQGDLILGNWSQYLEGTYEPLQSAESIHVRFVNHERAFKFWTRNCAAPWWLTVLTPKNGAATMSPFVTLDAR